MLADFLADTDSRGGLYLSLRTEFDSHSECRSSVVVARRSKDDSVFPQAQLICGKQILHVLFSADSD